MEDIKKLPVPTLEELKYSGSNECDIIKSAQEMKVPYPDRPPKPMLNKNHTSADALEYAKKFEAYEKEMISYSYEMKMAQNQHNAINEVIEEYIKDENDLNSVPEQYREKSMEFGLE